MAGTGVWVFKRDGVMQLEADVEGGDGEEAEEAGALERRLAGLGWERYYEDRAVVQLHRRDGGADLISLPRDFARFRSTHMYDVVLKNRDHFKVLDN
ncbi:Os03g0346200 [Oryza sativa Japonica Group]|uniref:Os03g0346200 protein n=1 Tax=Oryza sativa subsp. japonica TaxID=39947 RepID=A0A0P0VXC9_ORYSJ|nr:Os03g0346200 [Oryza sativa Japonica Group]